MSKARLVDEDDERDGLVADATIRAVRHIAIGLAVATPLWLATHREHAVAVPHDEVPHADYSPQMRPAAVHWVASGDSINVAERSTVARFNRGSLTIGGRPQLG